MGLCGSCWSCEPEGKVSNGMGILWSGDVGYIDRLINEGFKRTPGSTKGVRPSPRCNDTYDDRGMVLPSRKTPITPPESPPGFAQPSTSNAQNKTTPVRSDDDGFSSATDATTNSSGRVTQYLGVGFPCDANVTIRRFEANNNLTMPHLKKRPRQTWYFASCGCRRIQDARF